MASGVTKMEISIAAQVLVKRDALTFSKFTAPPDFHNTKMIREELAVFLSALPCNQWGGGTQILPDGLIRGKIAAAHRERCTGLHGNRKTQPCQFGDPGQIRPRPPHSP